MSRKKYKINWKKFTVFLIAAVLLVVGIGVLTAKLAGGADKKPNPKRCEHSFVDGVCTICGGSAEEYCRHSYVNGVCSICGTRCVHSFGEDNKCKICGCERDERLFWPASSTEKSSYPLTVVTDDYLVLVNKEYSMDRSYAPSDLVPVDNYVKGVGDPAQFTNCMRKTAAEALNRMISDAAAQGIGLKLRTGYRSYDYQEKLFNSYAEKHGAEEANKYSARAGQSEHQTGLACDLGAESQDYVLSDYFGDTPEGKWVKENCNKYGFILRYTDGTLNTVGKYTGYTYEAWHIRYVGEEAADIITQKGLTLEEYCKQIEEAQ